ncbi:MAG: DMT family transporter [Bacteroidales bacterium]|nr:DMT family transporter [Clostridium sp.]MCM1204519.1 DMT family transporter [Bacteroidales bacterium]
MKKSAPFFVLLAGILWGTMGIYVRKLNALGFTTIEIVAVRSVVTAVLLLPVLFFYDRKMLRIRLKDIWCFVGTGILSIVFFNYCYFKAITMTSLSVAAVLLYTAPAIVMVLSALLFQEKITGVKLISLAATFAGCVLVTGLAEGGETVSAAGILVGLGAGFGYALYSVFSRYAIERGYHSLTISFYTFVFASAGALPLADVKIIYGACTRNIGILGFYLVFALVSTVAPYILYTLGLAALENSKASIIASIEPVTATVLGIVLFGEKMTVTHFAGVVLVLGAIVLCNIHFRKMNFLIKMNKNHKHKEKY